MGLVLTSPEGAVAAAFLSVWQGGGGGRGCVAREVSDISEGREGLEGRGEGILRQVTEGGGG